MITMKFNIAAAAIAGGVSFAIALRVAGIINMPSKGYKSIFLDLMASVYPGYKASGTADDLLIGCFYAPTDGMITAGGLALLYKLTSCCEKKEIIPILF
jgi:hypothetical protein